jgi:hypothetical protein
MSPAEKVGFVGAVRSEIGLERALEIVGLARSTWYYRKTARSSYGDKYGHLRDALEEIARRHPEYGCVFRRLRTVIPIDCGHPFRAIADARSEATRPTSIGA